MHKFERVAATKIDCLLQFHVPVERKCCLLVHFDC